VPAISLQLLLPPATILSIGAVAMAITAHNDGLISSREQSATGTIVSHERQNHNRYGYRFRAEGTEFTGWETPLKAEPKIGQSVKVYFDPQNPAENSLTDFVELADIWRGRGIVLLTFCGVFVAVVVLLDLTVGRARPKGTSSVP
jgi:hypothetical protein